MADFKNGDTANWNKEEVREAQQKRRRKKRRRNPILAILLHLTLVLLLSAMLAGIGWLLFSDFCSFNRGGITATIQVTADDTIGTISDKLLEAGLIRYKWFFKLYASFYHAEEKIGLGTYTLNGDMDYHALISGMRSSAGSMNTDTVRVTIPEGYTVAQTIALLAKNGVNTTEALTEAAKTADFDYTFIDNDSEELSRLEGYLFPDTYDFYVNEKPASALNRLLSNFNRKLDDEKLAAAEARGYRLKDIVIIASLIEKETDGTDQARIASVIYNRLADTGNQSGTYRMLQVDASLLYALPEHSGAITAEDMKTDSPYNLYLHAGLPPTAIANPGLAAIEAAMEPEETNYYYYALGKDNQHHFFDTYDEHLAFVRSGDYIGN